MKLFITLAAAALVATPALADDLAPTLKVEYRDLDLTTDAGQTQLNRRIDAAARRVCRQSVTTGTRIAKPTDCFENAVRSARRSIAARAGGLAVAGR